MNDKILKILENRNIKPTSNRVLVLKAMLNFDWAFTLADLENEFNISDALLNDITTTNPEMAASMRETAPAKG